MTNNLKNMYSSIKCPDEVLEKQSDLMFVIKILD